MREIWLTVTYSVSKSIFLLIFLTPLRFSRSPMFQNQAVLNHSAMAGWRWYQQRPLNRPLLGIPPTHMHIWRHCFESVKSMMDKDSLLFPFSRKQWAKDECGCEKQFYDTENYCDRHNAEAATKTCHNKCFHNVVRKGKGKVWPHSFLFKSVV